MTDDPLWHGLTEQERFESFVEDVANDVGVYYAGGLNGFTFRETDNLWQRVLSDLGPQAV